MLPAVADDAATLPPTNPVDGFGDRPATLDADAAIQRAERRRIAERLNRRDGAATPPTGGGPTMLDDVLGVIDQNGSVLDGSMLDGDSSPPSDPFVTPLPTTSADDASAIAMQLLQTAAMLRRYDQRLDPPERHAPLVRQLRQSAASILQRALKANDDPAVRSGYGQ